MGNSKTCLYDLLCKYEKLEIPNIQRDYVMGSSNKLESLLRAMDKCAENQHNTFNFSCIMGAEEVVEDEPSKKKNFYVYDGQQRLTTLVFLAAFIMHKNDMQGCKYHIERRLCKKFIFNGRHKANEYLDRLLNSTDEENIEICDFTTYSISNLIKTYIDSNNPRYHNINLEFLMKRVIFDTVTVDKMGDAEQFFMDLNDGVKLEDYEIYKAELNYKINMIKENSKVKCDEGINKWSLKIDNEWLEYFLSYKTEQFCEEEIEVNFIKYCFRMLYVEKYDSDEQFSYDDLEWIEKEDINKVYTIMENLIKVPISSKENIKFLNYSWDDGKYEDIRGAYWNLAVDECEALLNKFIKTFTYIGPYKGVSKEKSQKEKEKQRKLDVLIWCYISNLDMENTQRKEYLRLIKKILNNNRIKNTIAHLDFDKIYYCRHTVFGIPEYYGNKFTSKTIIYNYRYLRNVLKLNYYLSQHKKVISEFSILNILKLWEESIVKYGLDDTLIHHVLEIEKRKYESQHYDKIRELEDCKWFNGLVENIIDDQDNLIDSFDNLENVKQLNFNDPIFLKLLNKYDYNIMLKYIAVRWNISGGYFSWNNDAKLIIMCLSDFFTHDCSDINLEKFDDKFCLKNLKNIKAGWFDDKNYLCRPKQVDGRSIYYSTTTNVIKDPICKKSVREWFGELFTKCGDSTHGIIYLPNGENASFIVLEQYVCENNNTLDIIEKLANDGRAARIIQAFDKNYYINNKYLKAYLSKDKTL